MASIATFQVQKIFRINFEFETLISKSKVQRSTFNVMVFFAIGNRIQILVKVVCVSLHGNVFGKGMNPSLLP